MTTIDVGSIVPSTRDLLQVVSTRRKNLALVALVGPERPAEDAARLAELNVSAFAFAAPGTSMQLAARATKTVPSLCLEPVRDRDACLAARFHGADGVCIDGLASDDEWDRLAKSARTMRMAPLALAADTVGAAGAIKAGARAVLLRGPSAAAVLELAAALPRALILIGEIEGADAGALRSLVGQVDAAIVPPRVHAARDFAELVAELDP